MRLRFLLWLVTVYWINNGANNVAGCDMEEFFNVTKTKKLVPLENDYYRFVDGTDIYVDEDYLTFWLKVDNPQGTMDFKILSIWKLRPTVEVFVELYGNKKCLTKFDFDGSILSESVTINLSACQCQPFVQNNENYVPFKIWTKNGPARVEVTQNYSPLNVYFFEESVVKMNDQKCLNERFLLKNYAKFDYTDLLTQSEEELTETSNKNLTFFYVNGTNYIDLKNSITVVWLKINDSSPEHFLLIENKAEKSMQKTFQIELEVNGRDLPKETKTLSNGFKISLKKELCIPNYYYFGFIRYVITVNEPGSYKASFYDNKSGRNLKLYFLREESNGIPKHDMSELHLTPAICSTNITEKRYITTSSYQGRFGNTIFRYASLYGIGKSLNRFPYLSKVGEIPELSEVFPLMADYIEIKYPPKGSEKSVNYGGESSKYDPPSNLNKYNASKYLKISGFYLQSWKYFEDYKSDIKKLLECSPFLKEKAKVEAKTMWKNNNNSSHKFCVHVRRGDFKQYKTYLETRADFLVPAIKHINFEIKDKTKRNTSLLIFGDDYKFIKNLTFPNMFTTINTFENIKNGSRGFEMCFAIEYCDTYLLSSSSSTFGWWIGYLMKSQGPVYYNAEIAKMKTYTKYLHADDTFPQNWKKLNVSVEGVVREL